MNRLRAQTSRLQKTSIVFQKTNRNTTDSQARCVIRKARYVNRIAQSTRLRFLLTFGFTFFLILSSIGAFAQGLAPIAPTEPLPPTALNSSVLNSRLDLPMTAAESSAAESLGAESLGAESLGAESLGAESPGVMEPDLFSASPATSSDDSVSAIDQGSNSPSDLISRLESPKGAVRSVQFLLIMGAFTLVPALLIMTTSFVRIIVVLSLLRQALGVQNLPPQQVISGLAVFMTLFIMYPTFQEAYYESLVPYQNDQISLEDAWKAGIHPVRQFMSEQIQKAGNDADVWLFWRYAPNAPSGPEAEKLTYDDVPTQVLVPAFMVSELKIAFLMGAKFFIPFLIIDFLVASITVSMGIMMLPPAMISLPLKLLLFVMLDGWHLVVESLIQSFF